MTAKSVLMVCAARRTAAIRKSAVQMAVAVPAAHAKETRSAVFPGPSVVLPNAQGVIAGWTVRADIAAPSVQSVRSVQKPDCAAPRIASTRCAVMTAVADRAANVCQDAETASVRLLRVNVPTVSVKSATPKSMIAKQWLPKPVVVVPVIADAPGICSVSMTSAAYRTAKEWCAVTTDVGNRVATAATVPPVTRPGSANPVTIRVLRANIVPAT